MRISGHFMKSKHTSLRYIKSYQDIQQVQAYILFKTLYSKGHILFQISRLEFTNKIESYVPLEAY